MTDPLPAVRVDYALTGLVLPTGLDVEDWIDIGKPVVRTHESTMWWIGDWLLYAEEHYRGPEQVMRVKAAVQGVELSPETVRNACWVARCIPFERRIAGLPWAHHREVAALPADVGDRLLREAVRDGLSRRDMRLRVNRLTAIETQGVEPEECADLVGVLARAVADQVEPDELLERVDDAGYRIVPKLGWVLPVAS